MNRRWLPVTILVVSLLAHSGQRSLAQPPEEPSPVPLIESPPPVFLLPTDEHRLPELTPKEQQDAVMVLGELRSAARVSPDDAEERLKLAQGLYRIGDVDAAIEEGRAAIRLKPDHAQAHLQLGVMLMAKQEWRAAASVLKEAIRLEPELPHAHYSLGSVQYSSGNVKAAIQSYRQALELQPHFPDARYRLALLLKLTARDREAAQLMEEAAHEGIPQAQFFLGNAYKNGQGVEQHLGKAIFWWTQAVDFGHQPAAEALSKLRRQALSPDPSDRRKKDALDGFQSYRDTLWEGFPEYSRTDGGETLGTRLLKEHRADEAPAILLMEGYALSEAAQAELATLYETGLDRRLAPFDKKMLACFEATAAEGFATAKKILARIYANGIGVAADPRKAKALLKGLSKQATKSALDELGLHE